MMRYTLILVTMCTACAAAAETPPRPDIWVSYQGVSYSRETVRTERGAIQDHGDGFIPQFRVRVRERAPNAPAPLIDVEPNASSAARAALLFRIATLGLPPGTGSSFFDYNRNNRAWRWRYDRIRAGAREVAEEVDLLAERDSPAAEVCCLVEVNPGPDLSRDRCRIEAIIDQSDGWPISAQVTRRLATANGSTADNSVTFERLQPR